MERRPVLLSLIIFTFLVSLSPAQAQLLTKHHPRLGSSDFKEISSEVSQFPYMLYSKSTHGGEFNSVSGKCSDDIQRVADDFTSSEDYATRSKYTTTGGGVHSQTHEAKRAQNEFRNQEQSENKKTIPFWKI